MASTVVKACSAGNLCAVAQRGARLTDDAQSVWVWRTLDGAHRVLANLDVTNFSQDREQLRWRLVLLDLLVSVLCAALGFVVARQMQRPTVLITQHLQEGLALPAELIESSDPESARLMRAVNRMADDAREREAMMGLLAEQEREAVLGRLAATRYFFHYELPKIGAWLQVVSSRDPTCAELPEEAF